MTDAWQRLSKAAVDRIAAQNAARAAARGATPTNTGAAQSARAQRSYAAPVQGTYTWDNYGDEWIRRKKREDEAIFHAPMALSQEVAASEDWSKLLTGGAPTYQNLVNWSQPVIKKSSSEPTLEDWVTKNLEYVYGGNQKAYTEQQVNVARNLGQNFKPSIVEKAVWGFAGWLAEHTAFGRVVGLPEKGEPVKGPFEMFSNSGLNMAKLPDADQSLQAKSYDVQLMHSIPDVPEIVGGMIASNIRGEQVVPLSEQMERMGALGPAYGAEVREPGTVAKMKETADKMPGSQLMSDVIQAVEEVALTAGVGYGAAKASSAALKLVKKYGDKAVMAGIGYYFASKGLKHQTDVQNKAAKDIVAAIEKITPPTDTTPPDMPPPTQPEEPKDTTGIDWSLFGSGGEEAAAGAGATAGAGEAIVDAVGEGDTVIDESGISPELLALEKALAALLEPPDVPVSGGFGQGAPGVFAGEKAELCPPGMHWDPKLKACVLDTAKPGPRTSRKRG